jgi:hypothetical protein
MPYQNRVNWIFADNRQSIERPATTVQVLTLPLTVQAIGHGFMPDMHSTAQLSSKKVTAL